MAPAIALETAQLKAQLVKKLDTLPQRDLIDNSDASQWIDYMANIMPSDAMWHMIRAGGVGGSEIGGLVRNYLGHRADHAFSAHNWAESKLLRRTPEPAQGVLIRGHEMEPIHAKRFYSEYSTDRDHASYDKLSKAQGSAIWMRYSPDDMIVLTKPTSFQTVDGAIELSGRILLDYKAPTSVDEEARIAFQYSCQLHQGAILCKEQGIEITGAMLSQFNWATWSLKNDYVEINPELCELIQAAGDHYWEYVMRGEVPPYVVRKRLELDPKLRDDYAAAAMQLGMINGMKRRLENASKDLKEAMVKGLGLEDSRLDGQSISFPDAMQISASSSIDADKVRAVLTQEQIEPLLVKEKATKYDVDACITYLKSINVDIKQFKIKLKLDPSSTFDALVEAGFDPEDFIQETIKVTVDKGVVAHTEEWFEESFDKNVLPGSKQTEETQDASQDFSEIRQRPAA